MCLEQTDKGLISIWNMEKLRACPICPSCGSKKFDRLESKDTLVRCVKCGKEMVI